MKGFVKWSGAISYSHHFYRCNVYTFRLYYMAVEHYLVFGKHGSTFFNFSWCPFTIAKSFYKRVKCLSMVLEITATSTRYMHAQSLCFSTSPVENKQALSSTKARSIRTGRILDTWHIFTTICSLNISCLLISQYPGKDLHLKEPCTRSSYQNLLRITEKARVNGIFSNSRADNIRRIIFSRFLRCYHDQKRPH